MNTALPKTQAETVAPPPPGPGELIERVIAACDFTGALVRSVNQPATLKTGIDIAAWQRMALNLTALHEGWQIRILPPRQTLPTVQFGQGTANLGDDAVAHINGLDRSHFVRFRYWYRTLRAI